MNDMNDMKATKRQGWVCMVIGALLSGAQGVAAMPVVSVDLDPLLPGIQSVASVDQGDTFVIDLVLTVPVTTPMDTFVFELAFNSSPGTLGLSGGNGSPTAGGMVGPPPAGIAPFGAFDSNAFFSPGAPLLLSPGAPMTAAVFMAALPSGYTSQSGTYGILVNGAPSVDPGEYSMFSLTFEALTPGNSSVLPIPGSDPSGGPGGIFYAGSSVPFDVAAGAVTVLDTGVELPEPPALALFFLGLISLRRFSLVRFRDPSLEVTGLA